MKILIVLGIILAVAYATPVEQVEKIDKVEVQLQLI